MSQQTPSTKEVAIKILGPLVAEVQDWLSGKDGRRPRVLALLPNELQSEIALRRLEQRRALGLEKEAEPAPKAAIELPHQVSSLRVTTGSPPENAGGE